MLLFLSTINQYLLQAQDKQSTVVITGRVVSFEESLGLEGVTITEKGTKNTSGTHADGTFAISVSSKEAVLVFSLDDYENVELKLTQSTDYAIVLRRKE